MGIKKSRIGNNFPLDIFTDIPGSAGNSGDSIPIYHLFSFWRAIGAKSRSKNSDLNEVTGELNVLCQGLTPITITHFIPCLPFWSAPI